jgi:hypothetical protein
MAANRRETVRLRMRHPGRVAALLGVLAVLAPTLAACGGDDGEKARVSASHADRAFLEAMIPHHESAVEMARLAKRRAQHRQVSELADTIVETQREEISDMEEIHQRLFDEEIIPNPDAHQGLLERSFERWKRTQWSG